MMYRQTTNIQCSDKHLKAPLHLDNAARPKGAQQQQQQQHHTTARTAQVHACILPLAPPLILSHTRGTTRDPRTCRTSECVSNQLLPPQHQQQQSHAAPRWRRVVPAASGQLPGALTRRPPPRPRRRRRTCSSWPCRVVGCRV